MTTPEWQTNNMSVTTLAMALTLAIAAPDNERYLRAQNLVQSLCVTMTPEQIKASQNIATSLLNMPCP